MTDPTTGMAIGSDAGAPGDHLPPAPLPADTPDGDRDDPDSTVFSTR